MGTVLFSSCIWISGKEQFFEDLDYYLFHRGEQVLCWSVEYEIDGESVKYEKYRDYNEQRRHPAPNDVWRALTFFDNNSERPLSIMLHTNELSVLFVNTGNQRFDVNKTYYFDENCQAKYCDDNSCGPFSDISFDILNGNYSFEVKKDNNEYYTVIVYFNIELILLALPDSYNGRLSIGDTIHINKGKLIQPEIYESEINEYIVQ